MELKDLDLRHFDEWALEIRRAFNYFKIKTVLSQRENSKFFLNSLPIQI